MAKREPVSSERPGPIELLFDVAFVFALIRLAETMFADLTLSGVGRTLLLAVALWRVWELTIWTTNQMDVSRPPLQIILVGAMLGVTIMGVAAQDAYGRTGLIFAATYATIQIARTLFVAIVLRGQQAAAGSIPTLLWISIGPAIWIAGSLIGGDARVDVWTVAVVVTYLLSHFQFRWPWPGVTVGLPMRIMERHLAERYEQIIILALGDKILSAGLDLSDIGFQPANTLAFLLSFTTAILLWWLYFHRVGPFMAKALTHTVRPRPMTRAVSYAHMVMFAGILIGSVGEKIVVSFSTQPATALWAAIVVGGSTLFLIGRERLDYLTFQRVSVPGTVGIVGLIAVAPVMISWPSLFIVLAVDIILVSVVIVDAVTAPRRLQPPVPPLPDQKQQG